MELEVIKPGMLTSVQDLGRWGFQASGVPVAGAMDLPALRIGNVMLGNPEGAAALEVTLLGPEISAIGSGLVVFAGAELGFTVNGRHVGSWNSLLLNDGDIISFSGPEGNGCRGYLCAAGGMDVPVVMGSRSTYMRAKIGGYQGRSLRTGDVLKIGEPDLLWKRTDGFTLPEDMRPDYFPDKPLLILAGLQEDAFTDDGIRTLFESEYTISSESDRMGCRFEGLQVQHKEAGADIVSDAIPLGAVQIPGHGKPIAMLADRQTTGGYTKIGVLTPASIQKLVQRMPGMKVRFAEASMSEAVEELVAEKDRLEKIKRLRASWVSRAGCTYSARPLSSHFIMTVNGEKYDVKCEEL